MTATEEPSPVQGPRHLHCGSWSAELRGDELADIRHDGVPVLRGIRAVVRNHNWLTLTPRVTSVEETGRDGAEVLLVRLGVRWEGFGGAYEGTLVLRLEDHAVAVDFHGTATEDLRSNRIGLVVLHRADDAGLSVAVTAPDGATTRAAFPREISPHQPFKDIAALEWERGPALYRLDFDGDVFETEDQRNWTDASFKTYSTPLERPFPILHAAGSRIEQSVRLSVKHRIDILDETIGQVPELGTSLGIAPVHAHESSPGLGFVLAEIAAEPDPALATVSASEALRLASALGVGLDARIVAATADEAKGVLDALPLKQVRRLGIFSSATHVTEPDLWDVLVRESKEQSFDGQLVAGARSHFTELNRNTGSVPATADAVAYAITAQMHAVEPLSVADTVPMQALTATAAARIGHGRPLHIGPITIAPRFNAVATEKPTAEEAPRPHTLQELTFAAAWLLGSVAALTRPGVVSLSYATAAELGTPAGRLLLELAALSGQDVLAADGTREGLIAYPVRTPGGIVCFTANLTPWAVTARIGGPVGEPQDVAVAPWSVQSLALQ